MKIEIVRGTKIKGQSMQVGAVVEVPDGIANYMINSGHAIAAPAVTEEPPKRRRRSSAS